MVKLVFHLLTQKELDKIRDDAFNEGHKTATLENMKKREETLCGCD